MAPWLALINTAPGDVGELDQALQSCAGTTDDMAEAMMSGFGGSLEKLKSSIDVLVTSIGEALAPTIQKVAEFIQGLVDQFNALTPAQQETIVKIGLIVAAVGPLLVIVGKVITAVGTIMTIVPKISGAITAVKGAFAALNAVMLANPIVLIIAAIAALATVGGLKAQLKQAVLRSEASEYVRKDSFNLTVSYDKFLYERTSRRKIETNQKK